jgi:hypothetical protein
MNELEGRVDVKVKYIQTQANLSLKITRVSAENRFNIDAFECAGRRLSSESDSLTLRRATSGNPRQFCSANYTETLFQKNCLS